MALSLSHKGIMSQRGAAPSALVQNEEERMQSWSGLNVNKKKSFAGVKLLGCGSYLLL